MRLKPDGEGTKQRKHWTYSSGRKTKATPVLALLAILVLSAVLSFGVEWIQRGTLGEAWTWLTQNPRLAWVNYVLNTLVVLLVFSVLGSFFVSAGISAILLFGVALISYFKGKMIGNPLLPWDLALKKEGADIVSAVATPGALLRLGIVLAIAVSFFLLKFVLPRMRMPLIGRLALGLMACFALYGFGVNSGWAAKMAYQAGFAEITWDQKQNYTNNGLALAFTMNVKHTIVPKPDGYSEPAMAELAQTINEQRTQPVSVATVGKPTGKKPNVIFVMNEAFWDPTLLPNTTFSEDPLPNVHKLHQQNGAQYMLSPQFGGGTSNVEFEVLSGTSMSFLPGGSVPYQQYISRPVPSLASFFEDQGYKSMAIHSYDGWFWNRENVYEKMGFEAFKSKEHFDNPTYAGPFISDDEVANSIIDEVDKSDRPMFIYAVTMQNHGGYEGNRYPENPIKVTGNFTPSAQEIIDNYTHGAKDADAMLGKLVSHFEQTGEPTVVVFYGDHLPMLGLGYDVYKQAGFIQSEDTAQWTPEELKKMRSVPLAIWSNTELTDNPVPTISASFLGGYVLDRMNMKMPAPFAYGSELSKKLPGLLSNLVIDANQQLHTSVPEELKPDVERYRELQYDTLFGKQYLSKYIDEDFLTKNVLPNYNEQFRQTPVQGSAS
ncbi:phosphoglycerol transferase [Paenibacillus sp. J31TS4]|uniref:LTA synthase family protein n=1 Tax=Paenibacillus sp. J31TS4 TaxID=2807195 RepID=UPI001B2A9B96|nr:LTA synthase family protein [Paenibacillus sp. J31TS4]GIP40111.1 phosphoglycerol transferase [Paenibacillus sp. J31TS4]